MVDDDGIGSRGTVAVTMEGFSRRGSLVIEHEKPRATSWLVERQLDGPSRMDVGRRILGPYGGRLGLRVGSLEVNAKMQLVLGCC